MEDIIKKYITAAIAYGNACIEGNDKNTNKQYCILRELYKEIKKNEDDILLGLFSLRQHENDYVKLWASAHIFDFKVHINEQVSQ